MATAGASAQHCTGMTNWPNTIQCLGSDDIMSLGIKSFATEGVGTKLFRECTMVFWIHDGFLDSRWVPGFTMGSLIHDGLSGKVLVPTPSVAKDLMPKGIVIRAKALDGI